jgi:hypothetical protein
MNFIRPDYLFSYWTFVWFLIYYFFPYSLSPSFKENGNPLLILCLELLVNIFQFIYFIFSNLPFDVLVIFLCIIFFTKGLPIYLLSKYKINWKNNIFMFIIIFFIYNCYLFLNGTNIIKIYKNINKSIINKDNKTPFFFIIYLFKEWINRYLKK